MAAKAHPEEHEHNSDLSSSSPSSSSQGKVHESMKENGGQKNKKEEKVGGVIRTALDEMSKGGSFERKESTWRDAISRGAYVHAYVPVSLSSECVGAFSFVLAPFSFVLAPFSCVLAPFFRVVWRFMP